MLVVSLASVAAVTRPTFGRRALLQSTASSLIVSSPAVASTDLEELTQSILSKPMPVEPEAVSRFASAPPTRAKFVKPAPDPLPTPHPIVEPDKGAQAACTLAVVAGCAGAYTVRKREETEAAAAAAEEDPVVVAEEAAAVGEEASVDATSAEADAAPAATTASKVEPAPNSLPAPASPAGKEAAAAAWAEANRAAAARSEAFFAKKSAPDEQRVSRWRRAFRALAFWRRGGGDEALAAAADDDAVADTFA